GRLAEAWRRVVQRHGTLRTVLRKEGAQVRVHPVEITGGRWERFLDRGHAVLCALYGDAGSFVMTARSEL
ncbi:hypothetical protein, partial [Corynebacterium sp. CNJ-954]|uniref:hypothetical protein n=1 Tax=Corynebacterium sp. CNJ-954 TaxID=1904962 RepID=UPI000B1EDA31